MKVLLTTLNSKFIHSNLAIRYLREYAKDFAEIEILEFTINQPIEQILSAIYKADPELVGFSTYIWNISEILEISEALKIINPKLKIMLGGPEVSFDGSKLLETHKFIDYIVYGEGEESFREMLLTEDLCDVKGLIFRNNGEVIINPPRGRIKNLDVIPSPYESVGDDFKNKIVYYESSRGCPFNCEFCLSSTIKGVRFFSIDRVKKDIKTLVQAGVSQIKFVDRTFNSNTVYSREVMDYIIELNPENVNFHFEVTAHLIDDETLEYLKIPKEGLFQFEIGVQSTNPQTIESIGRVTDFEKLKFVTTSIRKNRNIHQHLDLIAGLPYEDYDSFANSFNEVYSIRPEKLQLGFLKLLKGSGLRLDERKYGYKYLKKPPYEVLQSKWLDYGDILRLKGIENLVEKYYNEGYFLHSLEFIIKNFFKSPFEFYENFASYWESIGLNEVSHSRNGLYQILVDYFLEKQFGLEKYFMEIIKLDYIFNNKKLTFPVPVKRNAENLNGNELHDLLKNEELIKAHLYEYRDLPTKKLINKIIVEAFSKNILGIINNNYDIRYGEGHVFILFDYKDKIINRCKAIDITNFVTR
ncbi:DUF4080 domain-containing protein [Tissierella creatinini]|nr:DUF4080 domain-containing protein [Tissierella creatinini]TJX63211.1 DUF4080 domain-containing protein [Soehngenia saccharolytica]